LLSQPFLGSLPRREAAGYLQLRGKHTYKCSAHQYNKKYNSKSHNPLPFLKILSMMSKTPKIVNFQAGTE